jgi:serine/threonine protein kinase
MVTPVLLDFGVARFVLGEETMSLSVVLTRGFAPYEQYHRKGKQGPWTDLYSCGATFYYLLTGMRPDDAIERSAQDELPRIRDLNPSLSWELSEAIMKALELDVDDRPQSVGAF